MKNKILLAMMALAITTGAGAEDVTQARDSEMKAQLRQFQSTHAKGELEKAEAMLIADPTYTIGDMDFMMAKRDFLTEIRHCSVIVQQPVNGPDGKMPEGVYQEMIWFKCPPDTKFGTDNSTAEQIVRTGYRSSAEGISIF